MARHSLVHDGGRLRLRLGVLVLVPLIGCGVLTALRIDANASSSNGASRADTAIRAAAAVDVARGAFAQEILPALTAGAVRHPESLGKVDSSTAAVLAGAKTIAAQLPALRRATNIAIADLVAFPSVRADGRRILTVLATARASMDALSAVSNALDDAQVVLTALADSESRQVALATGAGLDAAGTSALQDVDLVSRAIRSGTQEFALYSSTRFVTAAGTDKNRVWALGWADYVAASAAVTARASATVAQLWAQANASTEVGEYNRFMAAQFIPSPPGSTPIPELVRLAVADGARNIAYLGVLRTTLDLVLAAGRAQHHAAQRQLAWMIAAAIFMFAISVALCIWIRRSVTRPLDRLAAQAILISQGELTDVAVSGPREVRTVARALHSSVVNLRNIEAHAAAVAAGDLDHSVLREPLPGTLGEVVHSSVARIMAAIDDRETAQRELAHRAGHDALTELPNRAQAVTLINQALHRGQRAVHKTALMFIDLDYFKAVNDSFGHAMGDEVLQIVARRVVDVVRDGDSVARLGGDEFVVLLEDVDDEADVVRLAERVVQKVSSDMLIDHRTIRVGASIGISLCRDGYVDGDRLLQEADAAAYRAKNNGRGRVDVFDDDLRAELAHRTELEHAIARGLAHSEFVLYYQPVIDLLSGRTHSAEALIRWNRPGYGLVTPDQFIPLAEKSGLIIDIGRWALREATEQLARWQHQDAPPAEPLAIAVNISGRHLTSHQLVTDVTDALTRSGIEPGQLVLELNETVLVDDLTAAQNLQTLRDLGVQIAIDDFGTGFTSIGELPRLNVDTLKIDRSFVASADPTQQQLVRLIVASAHAFGLTVVAEGIEDEEQAEQLRFVGAEFGQGFLFARPLPPADVFPQAADVPSEQVDAPR